jgi:hypothetical protein
MQRIFGTLLLALACTCGHAQEENGRPGCTAILDEAALGKPKSQSNKYTVAASWRSGPGGTQVRATSSANGVGGSNVTTEWRPVGFGWIALDYSHNLYYRVSYSPDSGYTLDVSIPELGSGTCSWR